MKFDWDPAKASSNLVRHGIPFADAVEAFRDPRGITVEDDFPDEERFILIGMDAVARLVVVVYTLRGDITRIISARRATRTEADHYAR